MGLPQLYPHLLVMYRHTWSLGPHEVSAVKLHRLSQTATLPSRETEAQAGQGLPPSPTQDTCLGSEPCPACPRRPRHLLRVRALTDGGRGGRD